MDAQNDTGPSRGENQIWIATNAEGRWIERGDLRWIETGDLKWKETGDLRWIEKED